MTFADWIRGAAPFGLVFVSTLVAGGLGIWLYSLVLDRRERRVDDALRAELLSELDAPPPPYVSPFASPRTRTQVPPQAAEGEVNP